MKIIISGGSKEPIYSQIKSQIKEQIISGKIEAGSALPSIRSLAKELQVSVITTKRAYDELENEGYINSMPGKGSFVLGQDMDVIREHHLKQIQDKIIEIIDIANSSTITKEEVCTMIDILWE